MPVRKRGRVWWVSVSYRGQRVRASSGAHATKEQAKELEAKILADFHSNRVGRKPDRLLSEALLKWLDVECKHLKASKKFESHARALFPFIKAKTFSQVGLVTEDIKKTMSQAGLSAATINRRLAILRRVTNLAYDSWGWLDAPLGRRITLLFENCHRHVYLTPAEVTQLADACRNPEAKSAILLAAHTGLRRGELLKLKADNLRDGFIVLDANTKSGRPRVIPIPDGFSVTLPLKISDSALRKQFEAARKSIERTDVRFHDLRHTYASWLVQAGAPLTAVRDILGHSTLSITGRYAHLGRNDLVDAVKRTFGHNPGTIKKSRKRVLA